MDLNEFCTKHWTNKEPWEDLCYKTERDLKSAIFWDITHCVVRWVSTDVSEEHIACHLLSRWFLAQLIFRPWRRRRYVPRKRRLTLNGLHCVISQKMVLFIATGVITSNLTERNFFICRPVLFFALLISSMLMSEVVSVSVWEQEQDTKEAADKCIMRSSILLGLHCVLLGHEYVDWISLVQNRTSSRLLWTY
jgi:hypothetical protein